MRASYRDAVAEADEPEECSVESVNNVDFTELIDSVDGLTIENLGHAYQVVRRHGIPVFNIVLMMYDNVANSKDNPYPGELCNKPKKFKCQAVDLYKGCHVDYRGDDVRSLVLSSLFILVGRYGVGPHFVHHGAPGLVVFPKDNLYTKDLIMMLKMMHAAAKKYKKLNHLPAFDIDVFATTATHESSWGTYCPPLGDKVDLHLLDTCLSDLYSVNWLEDSDASGLTTETLQEQNERVKRKTNKSHLLEFGSTETSTWPMFWTTTAPPWTRTASGPRRRLHDPAPRSGRRHLSRNGRDRPPTARSTSHAV
ncbi:Aste57867_23537 [Aphanomyces stellatus]|uniref:Aste57867_23537 protein n=1 Tax=Aphanomyces stellatus TaxID=120398 RepID=A0A485LSH8_9STRA|nr:hypothetical protein As57867_023466 [Aphanomyces stellatus]VFU00182.1 Aste57867_23537 [Aphanomyces stellatus]